MEVTPTTPSAASPKRVFGRRHRVAARKKEILSYDATVALVDAFEGLTLRQLKFLAMRPHFENNVDACIAVGVSIEAVKAWRERNPKFLELYNLIRQGQHYTLGKLIYQFMLPLAAYRSGEMLDAEKEQGERDWVTVGKGIELIQKGSGLTQDRDTQPANIFNTIIAQIKEQWSKEEIIESSPVASEELPGAAVGRREDR